MTQNSTPVTGPRISMPEQVLQELLSELARRGAGRRESGGFLLAERRPAGSPADADESVTVAAIAFYDDLDPTCLTGGITFSAGGYTALNALCRREGLRVVGDIHTHPRSGVTQSHIDSSHPMAALDGHLALIAPNYAQGPITPDALGAHIYHHGGWTSHYGADVATVFTITTHPTASIRAARLRAFASQVFRTLTRRGAR